MTDPTDLPPIADGASDDADARWFRGAVAPVIEATPVPDAWDDIRARATGESPTVVALSPTTGRTGQPVRRRLALAAAAVLAVAGIGGALAVTRDDDGGNDETVQATPSGGEATGWYIPQDLPDGWALESVSTEWVGVEVMQELCPCDLTHWISADGTRSLEARGVAADADSVSDDAIEERLDDIVVVDLVGEIDARVGTTGEQEVATWVDGDRAWQVTTSTLDRDTLIDAARGIAKNPADPPLEGFRPLFHTKETFEGVRAYHSVFVRLHHAERDVTVEYQLEPFEGFGYDPLNYLSRTVMELEPVSDQQVLYRVAGAYRPGGFAASWPGAWLTAAIRDGRFRSGPVTDDDVETIVRTLRPATGNEWKAFLDTATGVVDDDARADRLADLIVSDGYTAPDAPDAPATRLTAAAAEVIQAGQSPFPMDDLFAPMVAIGLDSETIRTVSGRDLVDPEDWVIDEDDVEYYAGFTPPFSALELLGDTETFSIVDGPTEGCAQPTPTPPPTRPVARLVTITPTDIDSCIDWFAVTLVLDEQDRISGVHLYLREP